METKEVLGKRYQPRIIDTRVTRLLGISGAVLIEGPRGCGKTMTGMAHAASYALMDQRQYMDLAQVDPQAILEGDSPHLIDEWQLFPDVWNMVRRAVDFTDSFGQYILTGSSVPDDDVTRHTGAARFMRVRQRTLTWWEKGLSSEKVSLAALCDGGRVRGEVGTVSLGQVIDGLLMSGFPALQRLEQDATAEQMRSYAEEISRTDMRRLADIRQDPVLILQLIKALARSTASEVTMKTLRADLSPVKPNIDEETVSRLVGLLERLFVVDAVGAWVPSLRSRARLRTSPKFHLCDPALSAAVLGASSQMLMKDVKTLGFLFESAVIHDLTVMVESMGGQVHHYRDSNGHEIDAVIVLPDGRWGGIEVKLGGGQAESGSRSLRAAADQIDGPEPAFLAVVTGTGQCLPPDERGVQTFPLSALAP